MRVLDGGSVLLADDDQRSVAAMARALAVHAPAVTVHQVSTISDAMRRILDGDADVLITDYAIGGSDPLGLVQRVRAVWPDLEIILVSASRDLDLALRAINEMDVRFLARKPVSSTEIVGFVQRCLGNLEGRRRRDQRLIGRFRA